MDHIVKMGRADLLCAIEDYLEKFGYKPYKDSYSPYFNTHSTSTTVSTLSGSR